MCLSQLRVYTILGPGVLETCVALPGRPPFATGKRTSCSSRISAWPAAFLALASCSRRPDLFSGYWLRTQKSNFISSNGAAAQPLTKRTRARRAFCACPSSHRKGRRSGHPYLAGPFSVAAISHTDHRAVKLRWPELPWPGRLLLNFFIFLSHLRQHSLPPFSQSR